MLKYASASLGSDQAWMDGAPLATGTDQQRQWKGRAIPPWDKDQDRMTFCPLSQLDQDSWGPRIVCVVGPSGIGKDEALDNCLLRQDLGDESEYRCVRLPLSTTRLPRSDEERFGASSLKDDLQWTRHIFFDTETFKDMIDLKMLIAWRLRETQEYYGLSYHVAATVLEDPRNIALISCGLRMSWLIKRSFGGLVTVACTNADDKKIRHWYNESERPKDEEEVRLNLELYRTWMPRIADYMMNIEERGDLAESLQIVLRTHTNTRLRRDGSLHRGWM